MDRVPPARHFALIGLALLLLTPLWCEAQALPGKPWSGIIPDPDTYPDWGNPNRPGYRYRGMLAPHKRFYDYIQEKRRLGHPLSDADLLAIRTLQTMRRWPEAPRPSRFWAAFMHYMRTLDTADLTMAQSLMLSECMTRGLIPEDTDPGPVAKKLIQYMGGATFQPRNWFERSFGRVENWMEFELAAASVDLTDPAPPQGTFPGEPFNGMQITYNVSGGQLGEARDAYDFTTARSMTGVVQPGGTLRVSGTVAVAGYGADLSVRVWAGDQEKTFNVDVPNDGSAPPSRNYDLSIRVPAGVHTGGFSVQLNGRYSAGGRTLRVSAQLGKSAEQLAREKAQADAEYRKLVDKTLQELGYEETPEGRNVRRMRDALLGGDATWKRYVDEQVRLLGPDTSPEARGFNELRSAMSAGGKAWQDYINRHMNDPGSDAEEAQPPGSAG